MGKLRHEKLSIFPEVTYLAWKGWVVPEMEAFLPASLGRIPGRLVLACLYREWRAAVSELRDVVDRGQ